MRWAACIACASLVVVQAEQPAHARSGSSWRQLQSTASCLPRTTPYCQDEPDNPDCTCGSCDQNRVVDNYLVNFCSDQLCEQTANDPNEPSKCTTPTDGSDPVCKTYQCSNFSPDVCRERAQALSVFPGEAATAVYFDCEELVCSDCKYATPGSSGMPGRCTGTATDATKTCDLDASTDDTADCPAGCDVEVAEGGCETHATSGCMYEVGTDPAAYFDLWAFALSTCDHCVDTADLQEICGSNDDPPRGFLRESYYAEQNAGLIPDPLSLCLCDDCYTTTTNAENVNTNGATKYREYCNLNRCDSSGTVWTVTGGQIKAPTPPPPPPAHFVPLAELAAKVGVSPNVAAGVLLISALLILYVCYFTLCGSRHHGHHSDGRGHDVDSSDEEDGGGGKYHRYTKRKKRRRHKKKEQSESESESGSGSGSGSGSESATDDGSDEESHHRTKTKKKKHRKGAHRHTEKP